MKVQTIVTRTPEEIAEETEATADRVPHSLHLQATEMVHAATKVRGIILEAIPDDTEIVVGMVATATIAAWSADGAGVAREQLAQLILELPPFTGGKG